MPERTWEWVYYSGPTRGRHWTGGATSGRLPSAQSCAMFVIPHRPRLHATTLRRVGVADAGVHRSNRSPRQIGTERQLSSTHPKLPVVGAAGADTDGGHGDNQDAGAGVDTGPRVQR